jgi:hypothetical protein
MAENMCPRGAIVDCRVLPCAVVCCRLCWQAMIVRTWPSRLGCDQARPAWSARSQLIDSPRSMRDAMDLGLHACEPTDIRAQLSAMRDDARGQLAKSSLSLVGIAKTRAIRRAGTYPLPDRERELARQTNTSSLDQRIKFGEPALPLDLGWMHPARHRLVVATVRSDD